MAKSWFTVTPKGKGAPVPEVLIYDEIGAWGVTPTSFYQAIKDLGLSAGEKASLRINSPGGDCFAGFNIYNMLLDTEAEWTIHVDGVAASMASLIATLPGAKVVIAANAFIMIHNPAAFAMGESRDMKRTAALLDSIRDTMASAYATRSGLEEDEVQAMMDAETWMDADEAIRLGFADSKGAENRLAAKFDLKAMFKDIPDNVAATLGKFRAGPAKTPQPKESAMDKNELSAAITEANKPLTDGIAALVAALAPKTPAKDDEADPKASFKAYIADVKATCQLAGLPAEADAFIAAETPIAEVRVKLAEKQAAAARASTSRQRPAPVTGRIQTHGGGAENGVDDEEDISDLCPPPITAEKAFANFHGKFGGRH